MQTPVAVAGGAGLGVSLTLIHIYVAPIKRFLQALWALGFCGGLFLALTQARSASCFVGSSSLSCLACCLAQPYRSLLSRRLGLTPYPASVHSLLLG